MAKMTKSDKIVVYLLGKGFEEEESRSRKWRKFRDPMEPGLYCFVGTGGGLRKGRNLNDSISLTRYVDGLLSGAFKKEIRG